MGIAENHALTCLKRLRESRLKSETLSTVIQIMSRCYEDPKAAKIFPLKPPDAGESGDQGDEGVHLRGKNVEVAHDPTEMKLDVEEDVLAQKGTVDHTGMEVDIMENLLGKEEECPRLEDGEMMEFSIDDFEKLIMDVDGAEPVEGGIVDQESLQQVEKSFLETADLDNYVGDNGISEMLEQNFVKGESARCGNEVYDCSPSREVVMVQDQQSNGPSNMLESANSQTNGCRTNVSDGIEEGGIEKCIAQEQSRASQEKTIDSLQLAQKILSETAGRENDMAKNSLSKVMEGEGVECGYEDNYCSPPQKVAMAQEQQMNRPNNMLESGNSVPSVVRTNASDEIEEGEIDRCNADVQLCVLQGNNSDTLTLQHTEIGADQLNGIEQGKLPKEASCADLGSSVLAQSVDSEKVKCPEASSDAHAECLPIKSSDTLNDAAKYGFECPIGSREPVFYGDISEEIHPTAQGALKTDADIKKKRGGNSKERKKTQKKKKRAELNKKLGVKRLKLPPPLKPKVIKVCEHYLKGRCLKGEECTFSHDATPLTKSKACVHFARNTCMKGDACPYDHELWKYPCDNYASKGFCIRGSNCSFSHEMPAKDESQGTSIADKLNAKASPIPADSKSSTNSAAKIPIKPPMRVPKGLTFLSMEKSDSGHLTKPNPSRSPQKIDVTGFSNSSIHVPGASSTLNVSSKPFSAPVTSKNDQSDHSNSNKSAIPKAASSKKIVDSKSPLDQALRGLSSLVPSKAPIINGSSIGLSPTEHRPSVSRLSGLDMHQLSGSSVPREKSNFKVPNQKRQISKSKCQVAANIQVEAAQKMASKEDHCLSSEQASASKYNQKLNTTGLKDQGSNKSTSVCDRGSERVYGNSHNSSSEELKTPESAPSSSSRGSAGNKYMSSPVQEASLSASSFIFKLASETKGTSIVSAENSSFKTQPESAKTSSSRSSLNCEPVKASAVLDFIFGKSLK